MIVATNNDLPGYRVTGHIGVVRGITVRSRSVIGNIGGAIQSVFGGSLSIYVELAEKARSEAFQLMIDHGTRVGADATATFILGGQIGDAPPDILLVYPEGNYIRASDDRPFLQIGESKYGKFLLEMAVEAEAGLVTASKIAIGSMMSTARANLSVGPPYDLAIYRTGSHVIEHSRIDTDSAFLAKLEAVWLRHLRLGLDELPMVDPSETTLL